MPGLKTFPKASERNWKNNRTTGVSPVTGDSRVRRPWYRRSMSTNDSTTSGKANVILLGITVLGLTGCAIGWATNARQFYVSYLPAFLFVLTCVMGMLFFVILHHLVDAGWSTVVRRPAEQVLAGFPVLLVLFVPIVIATISGKLFKWYPGSPDDHALHEKAAYLNLPFFLIRAGIFFGLWMLLSWIFRSKSIAQDSTGDPKLSVAMRKWAPPSMIVFALTISFAGFDWIMSLDHHWFSTIFGVYLFAGSATAALALLTLITLVMMNGRLLGRVPENVVHDLGKWIFAFSVFWGYIAFSQYFLIWYANIPEETVFFIQRWRGDWWIVSLLVPAGQFVLPFVLIMSANVKKSPFMLTLVSLIVLGSHYADMVWLTGPAHRPDGPAWGSLWMDASALLLIGGACALLVNKCLASAAAYPLHDPRLDEALNGGHGHSEAHAQETSQQAPIGG